MSHQQCHEELPRQNDANSLNHAMTSASKDKNERQKSSPSSCMLSIVHELNNMANALASRGEDDAAMEIYNKALSALMKKSRKNQCCNPTTTSSATSTATAECYYRPVTKEGMIQQNQTRSSSSRSRNIANANEGTSSSQDADSSVPLTDPLHLPCPLTSKETGGRILIRQCNNKYETFLYGCASAAIMFNMSVICYRNHLMEETVRLLEDALNLLPDRTASSSSTITAPSSDMFSCIHFFYCFPSASRILSAVLNNLGHMFHRQGRIEESLAKFARASNVLERERCRFLEDGDKRDENFALASRYMLIFLSNKGKIHYLCNEYDESVESFRHAVSYATDGEADDAILNKIAEDLHRIGQWYHDRRKYSRATHVYKHGLAIRAKLSNSKNSGGVNDNGRGRNSCVIPPVYFQMMYKIGMVHYTLGNRVRALQSFKLSVRLLRESKTGGNGTTDIEVAAMMQNIAVVQHSAGKIDDAFETLNETLERRRAIFGNDHALVSETLYMIGRVHHERGEYPSALRAYSETLRIETAALGENHVDVAVTMYKIGQIHRATGDADSALRYYRSVVRVMKARTATADVRVALPGQSPSVVAAVAAVREEHRQSTAQILQEIGEIHLEKGELSEAMVAFVESSRLFWQAAQDDEENSLNENSRASESGNVLLGEQLTLDQLSTCDGIGNQGAPAA